MSDGGVFNKISDWFIPDDLLAEREMRTRARMFLVSHMFGPILGNVIPLYLFWIDRKSAGTLAVLAASITGFWIFPFLLKFTGRYTLLSFISIQNLLFAIIWGCYNYGGLSSPFLPWLVTVPLLAFFYLGASVSTCVTILLQISISLGIFVGLYAFGGSFPHNVELADMQVIGVISTISASIYVSMMALFYAGILKSQTEFEVEVRRHMETAEQLREAASQAERAGAAKSEFLAKMSHELLTPLNAVIGYSQILLEDTDPAQSPQDVDDLNRIHAAGHHLLGLVNAILDLSKIEAGKMEVYIEPTPLAPLVQRVAERWRTGDRLNAREIVVRDESADRLAQIDVMKLEQVLDALIDNAVRYAPDGPIEISISQVARAGADATRICIADHGPGIAPELMPTLFETFSDLDDHSASKYGGAGLGLPLCSRLCELMGATLGVRPHEGRGARVFIDLSCEASADMALPQAA